MHYELWVAAYDNSLSAFVPQLWAQESLAILEEKMVIANQVYRDFEPYVATFGETVNTRKPADFTAKRKLVSDNVTVQDASATNVPVTLNQHVHTSFLIRDGEESKSFKDLTDEYIYPAVLSLARFVDKVVLGQYSQFYLNSSGRLGQLSKTTAADYIVEGRKVLNVNKAPDENRRVIWTPNSEAELLKTDLFISAERVGDAGTSLREASIGRKLGFDHFMCQNASSITSAADTVTGAVNNASGYAAGTVTMTVDNLSAAITANSWITVAGDDTPLRVVSTVGGATPTSITVSSGLKRAVVDNAVVTIYTPGQVNYASGYAVGYQKTIIYDTFTKDPQVGQMVTFGTDPTGPVYTILEVDTSGKTILLDRPLTVALADDAKIHVSPLGEYNFAFVPTAMALVIRPLATPRPGTGAISHVLNHNGLSMRITITYDGNKQGHLVTLDFLCGVAVLDSKLGAVILG